MNKGGLNRVLYFVITILIIWIIGSLFIRILPYLIVGAVILWGIFKLKGIFKSKGNHDTTNKDETIIYDRTFTSTEEEINNVVDVEYEELKK